ncbi:MFS transporter [Streptomyces sp. NPDC087294]|uniref:MFS transporter n=1 Tax=Streptomyces sp. NPDC087294 TaxID=3365777 RepID=UPI00382124BD
MSAPSSRPSYAAVLRVAHARRTFGAALIGRLSYGVVSVAVILTVTRATGSYGVAGTVIALYGALSVVLMPYRASLVDRFGPRRALTPMALLHSALLCVLAAAAWRPGAPAVALGVLGALGGACAPPLGPAMRSVWSELAPEPALLRRAYSLDGVAEELLYVTGPLLVGVVCAVGGATPPAAGLLLSAALMATGTLAFVTSPAVGAVGPVGPAGPKSPRPHGDRGGPGRALLQPVLVAAGVGLSLSVVDLLVVAVAERTHHRDDTVAWVLAALSAGSAVGGLLNGAVDWRTPARTRLPFCAAGLGITLAAAGLAPGIGTLAVAVACAGLFVAPTMTTAYLIAYETAPPGLRTRSGAWINTGINAGSSAGAAGAGWLLQQLPTGPCFALAGAMAVATALIPGGRRPRTTTAKRPAESPPPGA